MRHRLPIGPIHLGLPTAERADTRDAINRPKAGTADDRTAIIGTVDGRLELA